MFAENSDQRKEERLIYSLSYEDVQTVADEYLGRPLSENEIVGIEDAIAERIDWFGAIAEAISAEIEKPN